MFFRNISAWSKKVMWAVTIACYCLYFCLMVVGPAVTIMVKYDVFGKTEGYRNISGLGLVLIVVFGIYAFVMCKKAIRKLPDISVQEQRFRYTLELIFDMVPMVLIMFGFFVARDNIQLAFNTLKIILWFFVAAILMDDLFIKYIDAEWVIRKGAKLDKEKSKRQGVV